MSHSFEHPFALVKEGQIRYETAEQAAEDAKLLQQHGDLIEGRRVHGVSRRVYVDFELVKRIFQNPETMQENVTRLLGLTDEAVPFAEWLVHDHYRTGASCLACIRNEEMSR